MIGQFSADGDRGMSGQDRALRYPDFLGIGAQKSATTWLHGNLQRHPRIWLPPVKELHYFNHVHRPETRGWTRRHRVRHAGAQLERCSAAGAQGGPPPERVALLEAIRDGEPSDDWYGRVFAHAGDEQVCGEITPQYSMLPEQGILHVLRLNPGVRILLMLRDPVDRACSHISMMVGQLGLTDPALIEEHLRRSKSLRDVIRRSDYPAIIRRWRRHVPEGQFLMLFVEEVMRDPAAVLGRICQLLGVEGRQDWFAAAAQPVHVGGGPPVPPRMVEQLAEALRPTYEAMAEIAPEIGGDWLERRYGPA